MQDGIYAKFNTTKGEILVNLTYEKTPGTVGNFVSLAEGKRENSAKSIGAPYYDGLSFHRVIPDFMIQGGCPLGTGTGDPGYKFDDEFHPDLTHDAPGVLSMANAGPGTNGSQFFITHVATPWLDNKHTVFGNVVSGQEVVDSIAQGDVIESLEIVRVGEKAEAWDAISAFANFESAKELRLKEEKERAEAALEKVAAGFNTTPSGLRYKILEKGEGSKAEKGQTVSVHYEGALLDGQVFDSSFKRNEPIDFQLGIGQVIPGWDEGISLLKVGDKARFVIPSELAYGSAGAGGVIPPNATLMFDVELVGVK
ncbi:peptidylprolyl isomerase [Eudoraea chungangensis]|uniref:peptidylprolyl isomerase n=1 Tax=Eudoraea chungangensis TaxID=1481905 RepID=UPI0023ED1B48|nr:peptidylprolyl isomerase [Eudoraea chungangensis]